MSIGTALFLLLILACPLMMVVMMRGHGGGHEHHDVSAASVDELRRQRDELDREIAARADSDLYEGRWSPPADASPGDAERGPYEKHQRAMARR